MPLSERLNILLDPEDPKLLSERARTLGKSKGELVREALHEYLRGGSVEARLRAVAEIAALNLPVAD